MFGRFDMALLKAEIFWYWIKWLLARTQIVNHTAISISTEIPGIIINKKWKAGTQRKKFTIKLQDHLLSNSIYSNASLNQFRKQINPEQTIYVFNPETKK
jgi:t-SNARE complex subunit (syntaxin)